MLVASTSIPAVWFVLLGIGFTLAGAFAGYVVFSGRKGASLSDLQDKTITAYQAELNLANHKITALETQVRTQEQQILVLQDLVLQKAKVDGLIMAVDGLSSTVSTSLEKLRRDLLGKTT